MSTALDHSGDVSPDTVTITGVGMVTALGCDVVTSCAAARAGISRAEELPGHAVFDLESGELLPIVGHAARGITDGFAGLGRLLRLADAACKDLATSTAGESGELSGAGMFLAVSGGYYWTERHLRQLADADGLAFAPERIIQAENDKRRGQYQRNLIPRLARSTEISFDSQYSRVVFGEQVAFVTALRQAYECVKTGKIEKCAVGAVDSLVDPRLLDTLADLGLLKTPTSPHGFLAGEAAAVVLLERHDRARARGANIRAILEAPIGRNEASNRFSDGPILGGALATVAEESTSTAGGSPPLPGVVVANVNGDPWRSNDFGMALTRVPDYLRSVPFWYPVESFGECGAASGAVSAAVGVRSLERGYAGTDTVLVWISGDDGDKGAFVLRSVPRTRGG